MDSDISAGSLTTKRFKFFANDGCGILQFVSFLS